MDLSDFTTTILVNPFDLKILLLRPVGEANHDALTALSTEFVI